MTSIQQQNLNKAVGLPESIDPNHEYVYRSGEYGLYQYWYKDRGGNYWKYTNAPEGHAHHDPKAGEALMDPDQPMPHTTPQFYAEDGSKRNVAVPEGVDVEQNPNYDASNARNIWYEVYRVAEQTRYVYLDADVRENLDLHVQHQLRVCDAGITRLRRYAVASFEKEHPKDKVIGAILMLVDQGFYQVEDLAEATVGDLEFIDTTVKLLGRKFVCDAMFLDFMTSLVANRDESSPLFVLDTVHGKNPLGKHFLYSIFYSLKVSPHYLMYWHSSHIFSRIVNKLSTMDIPSEEMEDRAFDELKRVLAVEGDVRSLVDFKVKEKLLSNYADVSKGFSSVEQDDLAVLVIQSDLDRRMDDELEFSKWLHAEPLHDITPEEEAEIEEALVQNEEEQKDEEEPAEGGAEAGEQSPTKDGTESTPGTVPSSANPTPGEA
jgi:hypothetical protein